MSYPTRKEPVNQPAPTANEHPPIVPQVIADLQTRMQLGIQRYGVALQPANGRDMLVDAYEEAQDLAVYLKGAIETERLRHQHVDELVNAASEAVGAFLTGELPPYGFNRLHDAIAAVQRFNAAPTPATT